MTVGDEDDAAIGDDYAAFLQSKIRLAQPAGFLVDLAEVNPALKQHARAIAHWAVNGGRRAIFSSFGLGKTTMQLEIMRLVRARSGGPTLTVLPLGVRQEFRRDAERFFAGAHEVRTKFIRSASEIDPDPRVHHLTNYETVRDGKLDPALFAGASLDEADVLRGFGGSKTFRELLRLFERVRYRFVATATPSPNEFIELLAYAAFLDIMDVERILHADWTPPPATGFVPGFVPHPNQLRAIEVTRRLGRLLLLDDVGLGKTESALGTIAAPDYLPAAIVVQPHLATQWAQRCRQRTWLRPHVIEGTKAYGLPDADVYVFRYSNVHGWVDIAAQRRFRSVVFDEIQELRHGYGTVKGEACRKFAENAELRMGLSATPIYNQGAEIFDVMEFIAPRALGNWDEFLREWCGVKGVVEDPDALGTYLREQHLVLREVRSGRPVNTIVREIAYDTKVEAASAALARTLALKVTQGSFVERGQAARELDLLLRQITGVAKARHVAAFVRILLEAGTPLILAGWHRDVYDIWLEELREFRPVMYTGSETTAQKDRAKQAFCDGETDLFIISLRSGSGLDGLQRRCATIVIGELDWSPKVHEQLIGRVDRPGQTADEVTAVYLHADGGSDPLMVSLLGLKASQSRGITDPLSGVAQVYSDEGRIRQLAQAYLERNR